MNNNSQRTVILECVKIPVYSQVYIFGLPFKRQQETYKFTNRRRNIKILTDYARYLPFEDERRKFDLNV
jgi:hypothetical protein